MATYYEKYDKSHDANGIKFDALSTVQFAPINIAASQVVGTVQQALAVPQDCKIYHVAVTCTALSTAATIQIVSGGAAPGAVGTPNTANANGTVVFSAPVAVGAANTQTIYYPAVPEAVCDKTLPLTLRAVTASGNTVTNLQVSLAVCLVDPSPASAPTTTTNADPSQF